MLALFLAVMAAAWLIEAQDDNPSYRVHGSVAFIRSGERTPTIQGGTQELTAVGAQQMYQLGLNLRGRYITTSRSLTEIGTQQIVPITLDADLLDNDQIYIQTTDAAYLVASAQALMQGLYPPYSINTTRTGQFPSVENILANGSSIESPLGGYQYPSIQAASSMDPMSIYVAGTDNCPASQQESLMYLTTQQYLESKAEAQDFYQSLNASIFNGYYTQDKLDYINAIDIYDYLSYAYVHDSTVYHMLANDSTYAGVYDQLRYYANEQAWYLYGNTSASTTDDDYRAMAGKTLSALILGQLQKVVMNGTGMSDGQAVQDVEWHPISVLFGDEEPFISLFSLMELDFINGDYFRAIPPVGSAMIFELFSVSSDNGTFPSDANDLWVRFHFQNGTNYKGSLQAYPLFGRGPSGTDMLWSEFEDMMSRIMTNTLTDYCTACNSGALFCWGVEDSTINITMFGRGGSGSGMSPQVAGVIGAAVTLGVAAILFAIGMLIGGIRLQRVNRSKKSDLGGFKGSAKLASDPDLSLAKNGAAPAGIVSFGADDAASKGPRERVGSWELRQKEFGKGGDDEDVSRRASFDAIEAAMVKPVEPTERV